MAACYRMTGSSSGTQISSNPIDVPCPGPTGDDGHSQCCVTGDICLSNGICHFTHSSSGGSGYYTGACTDKTLNSGACAKACRRFGLPDIVYDNDSASWACCGLDASSEVSCRNPSNETFDAPAPQILLAQESVTDLPSFSTSTAFSKASTTKVAATRPTSTLSTSSLSSSSTKSVTIASPSTTALSTNSTTSTPSGLSTGAIAGISISCALAGALVAVLVWILFKRRKPPHYTKQHDQIMELDGRNQVTDLGEPKKLSEIGGGHRFAELGDSHRAEKGSRNQVWELADNRQ